MVTSVIIDDEPDARQVIHHLLEKLGQNFFQVVGEANSVDSAVKLLDDVKPQLVFLDLHLFNEVGFDILSRSTHKNFYVVIVTAHEQYGIQAVKAGANDYLLKPINPKEFEFAIKKILRTESMVSGMQFQSQDQVLTVTHNSHKRRIHIKDLLYIQADNNYSILNLRDGSSFIVAKTLKHFENDLSNKFFFRCHQSFLINMRYIEDIKLHRSIVVVKNEEIPISRRNKNALMDLYYLINSDE